MKKMRKWAMVGATLFFLVTVGLLTRYIPPISAAAPDNTSNDGYIWPNPNFTSWRLDSPALPKVESIATCTSKYGPSDWRTWRAQYFEKRLTQPDDSYRIEHSSFADIVNRGAECNIWTGYHVSLYGIKPENFVLAMWPGVGMNTGAVYCAFLHRGESSQIWNAFTSDTIIRVHKGSGEFYLNDHWIPVTRGDLLFAPPSVPHGFRVPEGNKEDMVVMIYLSPTSMADYQTAGILEPDRSETARGRGWMGVMKWTHPEEFGPSGIPSPVSYSPKNPVTYEYSPK